MVDAIDGIAHLTPAERSAYESSLRELHPPRAETGALPGGRVPLDREALGGRPGPRGARLSRSLRDRHVAPRPADPLRPPQPRSGDPGRAGLRPLGRHGGRAALAEGAAPQPRERASARGLRL